MSVTTTTSGSGCATFSIFTFCSPIGRTPKSPRVNYLVAKMSSLLLAVASPKALGAPATALTRF